MITNSHPQSPPSDLLINFLIQKLGVSKNAIDLGIRQSQLEQAPLPIILWSFGLITLSQYQTVLDWQKDQL